MGPDCEGARMDIVGPDGYTQAQRQKRMRTSFKHHQLRTMKSYFALNHNPDAKDLKQLAQKTGLTKRVLQVRFDRVISDKSEVTSHLENISFSSFF